jgi:glycosyltransferase involved in cell wall biosynthesis
MDLTIVIPTRNRPVDLAKMLRSLSSADKAAMIFEILVVDNNSDEPLAKENQAVVNSVELPSRYLQESAPGQSAALNTGIALARGEIVAFLDDDIVIHRDYFSGLKRSLELPADVFGGRVFATWPFLPPAWITPDGHLATSRGPIVAHDYGDEPKSYDQSMKLPVGCNFFCRRTLFERHGVFDVRLGPGAGPGILGGGETGLLRRFRAGGARMMYTPWVVVDHPVTPERMTKKYFRFRYFCAGRSVPYTVSKAYPSLAGVPRYLFRDLAATTTKAALAACAGRSAVAFDRQLHLCMVLGTIYEYARGRFQFQSSAGGSILKTLFSTKFTQRQIAK